MSVKTLQGHTIESSFQVNLFGALTLLRDGQSMPSAGLAGVFITSDLRGPKVRSFKMTDYACIYATGTLIRDVSKTLMERGLAIQADRVETFPMYFKNGKVKTGSNEDSVIILVERVKLEEAMRALQFFNQQNEPSLFYKPILAYALPVLAITGI